MPAIDVCEPQVIRALEKAGWKLSVKTYPIEYRSQRYVYADLVFEQAERQMIVVEVKCFTREEEDLDEFYRAVGQYLLYRNALQLQKLEFPLYLVVPQQVYERFFILSSVGATVKDARMSIIIVNLEREEIIP